MLTVPWSLGFAADIFGMGNYVELEEQRTIAHPKSGEYSLFLNPSLTSGIRIFTELGRAVIFESV